MARSAADLALLLDVIAGPDPLEAGVGYKLALPPARQSALKSFRVLLIDTDRVLPTSVSVHTAIEQLAGNLGKAGLNVSRASPLLPDFAASSRLYMRMLLSFLAASFPPDVIANARAGATSLRPMTRVSPRSACAASCSAIANGCSTMAAACGCARNGANCSRASMR